MYQGPKKFIHLTRFFIYRVKRYIVSITSKLENIFDLTRLTIYQIFIYRFHIGYKRKLNIGKSGMKQGVSIFFSSMTEALVLSTRFLFLFLTTLISMILVAFYSCNCKHEPTSSLYSDACGLDSVHLLHS